MKNAGFVEPVGPLGLTRSEAMRVLGGSDDRIDADLNWQREAAKRTWVRRMPRKELRRLLDELMARVEARDYELLGHQSAEGFFTDSFEIGVPMRDGSGSYCLVHVDGNLNFGIMTEAKVFETDNFFDWWIFRVLVPTTRRQQKILDRLREQTQAPRNDQLIRISSGKSD